MRIAKYRFEKVGTDLNSKIRKIGRKENAKRRQRQNTRTNRNARPAISKKDMKSAVSQKKKPNVVRGRQ
jgi:hypothetical protein